VVCRGGAVVVQTKRRVRRAEAAAGAGSERAILMLRARKPPCARGRARALWRVVMLMRYARQEAASVYAFRKSVCCFFYSYAMRSRVYAFSCYDMLNMRSTMPRFALR